MKIHTFEHPPVPTHSPLRECPLWGSQRGRPRDAVRERVQRRPQEGTEDSQERRLTQGTAVQHNKCSGPTRQKCSGPHSLKGPRSGLTRAEGNFSEGLGANPGPSDRTWACAERVRWGRPQAKTQKQRKAGRTRGTASTVKGGWGGASLVAQWLRIRLPMQGTRVRALVWEDPTCHGATGPVSHNY